MNVGTASAPHIVQYPKEYSMCLGCESCELICGLVRDGQAGFNRGGIKVKRGEKKSLIHTVYVCQQCEDHPCYDACPKQDEAMCVDENGIVYINEEECIGCGLCQKACSFEPARITIIGKGRARKARKCDLCRDRADGPQCIAQCPAMCLGLSTDPNPLEATEEACA